MGRNTSWQKEKTDNNRERYLTVNDIELLFQEIEYSITLWLFVKLALQTGGRLETILHIPKKDLDLSSGTVTLKNLKVNKTYKGFIQTSLIEFLSDYTADLTLNDYIISFDNHKIKTTSRQIQSRLKPILDRLFNKGLDIKDSKNRIVIHSLRHTFASHLAINGVPIFTIKELMNHGDIEQTMRYAKLAPDNGRNAVQGLYV